MVSWVDIGILLSVLAAVAGVFRYLFRRRKKGGGCTGCCASCGGCAACGRAKR